MQNRRQQNRKRGCRICEFAPALLHVRPLRV